MTPWIQRSLRARPFAYSEVYTHPYLPHAAFSAPHGGARAGLDPAIATVCKNESNCTVFLSDGSWFTTWSQGTCEHALDERIVFAVSSDRGQTWSAPRPIVQSTEEERMAYGAPFVVPGSGRIYLFFVAGNHKGGVFATAEYDAARLFFVYSDDRGGHWSERRQVSLPDRDVSMVSGRFHGWINHSPQLMPTGEVILPLSMAAMTQSKWRRAWQILSAEVSVLRCNNLLTEQDPGKLSFTLLPAGPRGIRADVRANWDNPALRRLLEFFNGVPYETASNFQEMTVVPLADGRWFGVGRTFLGSPGFTVSSDRGLSWTPVEPLRYRPGGEPIRHPMTMCPIAKTSDGRLVLLFTNNDGSERGARHVWDGDGRTRNPQWITVGREIPGETANAGLCFGAPMILTDVDDSGEVNLKTGISMPQFFEYEGEFFVCYNINKEHLLLDRIPAEVLARLTPA
jgi:hypothetical protein